MKKIFNVLFCIFFLFACSNNKIILPISLTSVHDEETIILNSSRDLNDIVTLRFNPKQTSNKNVIWSMEDNDYLSLNGSIITANKIGVSKVKATSVANNDLYAYIDIRVVRFDKDLYKINVDGDEGYQISSLNSSYYEGDEVCFNITTLSNEKEINEVKMNDEILSPFQNNIYKFIMPDQDVNIYISLKDILKENYALIYDIKYDLGSRKTAKLIETNEELFSCFSYDKQKENLISSIKNMEYIYGGGNGGRGTTSWYKGDMLKLGTTSINGSFTLNLKQAISKVVIKGYVNDSSCKIKVGDEDSYASLQEISLKDFKEASLDVITNNEISSIEVNVTNVDVLKIGVINNKPLFITNIELYR